MTNKNRPGRKPNGEKSMTPRAIAYRESKRLAANAPQPPSKDQWPWPPPLDRLPQNQGQPSASDVKPIRRSEEKIGVAYHPSKVDQVQQPEEVDQVQQPEEVDQLAHAGPFYCLNCLEVVTYLLPKCPVCETILVWEDL